VNEAEIAYSLILRLQFDKLVLEGKLQEAEAKLAAAARELEESEKTLADAQAALAQRDEGPSLGRAV
jgi:multidrug resistance efflux pump